MTIRRAGLTVAAALASCGLIAVAAATGAGASGSDPRVVAAPSNLSVSYVDGDTVRLTWRDNSNNEDRFEVAKRVPPNLGSTGPWGTLVDHRSGQPQSTGSSESLTLDFPIQPDFCLAVVARTMVDGGPWWSQLSNERCVHIGHHLVTVPNVISFSPSFAAQSIRNAELVPVGGGSGTWVSSQSPLGGTRVPDGSKVSYTVRGGEVP